MATVTFVNGVRESQYLRGTLSSISLAMVGYCFCKKAHHARMCTAMCLSKKAQPCSSNHALSLKASLFFVAAFCLSEQPTVEEQYSALLYVSKCKEDKCGLQHSCLSTWHCTPPEFCALVELSVRVIRVASPTLLVPRVLQSETHALVCVAHCLHLTWSQSRFGQVSSQVRVLPCIPAQSPASDVDEVTFFVCNGMARLIVLSLPFVYSNPKGQCLATIQWPQNVHDPNMR